MTLPATLWFLDKQKVNTDRKDKILFLDARNTYTQIDRAHREWKEEQIQNLAAIVRLYRGETDRYLELVASYAQNAVEAINVLPDSFDALQKKVHVSLTNLKKYIADSETKRKPEEKKKLDKSGLVTKINQLTLPILSLPVIVTDEAISSNKEQLSFAEKLSTYLTAIKELDATLKANNDAVCEIWIEADKILKLKADKNWTELELNNLSKVLDELQQNWKVACEQVNYGYDNMYWLQGRFPDAKYTDVVGLCKVADKQEYADKQGYSLNAGRYVGVVNNDDLISSEEFKLILMEKYSLICQLNKDSMELEKNIEKDLKTLIF